MKTRKMRIKIYYWDEGREGWEGKFKPVRIRIKSEDTVEILGEFTIPDKIKRWKLPTKNIST